MYDYELIFDIHIKNNAMKEEMSAAKEHVDAMMIKCNQCSDKVL